VIRNSHLLAMILASASLLLPASAALAAEVALLSADEVARRAQSTSFEVKARTDEHVAAQAAVDQAQAGYLPRLSGSLRYTRLSEVPASSLGNIVLAPTAAPGSVPDPARTVAAPMEFPSIANQYTAQATLQIPLSEYLVRVPQAHEAAKDSARASVLVERATGLRIAAEARVAVLTAQRGQQAAEESCRVRQVLFQNGRATSVELTDAETELTRARMELVSAQIDLRLAGTRLRHALGRDVD
jgi:outer membrane protein TolC